MDRLFGDPASPVPGVVFGEKGSGKSGLRRTMKRRLEQHNESNKGEQAFVVEYIDFDPFLESMRRHLGIAGGTKKTSSKLMELWSRSDHLDAMLSLAVTRLVDSAIKHPAEIRKVDRKKRRDLVTLAHLYYRSDEQTRGEAMATLQKSVGWFSGRPMMLKMLRTVLTVVGVLLLLLPHLSVLGVVLDRFDDWSVRFPSLCHWTGGILIGGTWIWTWAKRLMLHSRARRTVNAIRVVPGSPGPLTNFLGHPAAPGPG